LQDLKSKCPQRASGRRPLLNSADYESAQRGSPAVAAARVGYLPGAILEPCLTFRDGHAQIADLPGVGLEWRESEVARYLI